MTGRVRARGKVSQATGKNVSSVPEPLVHDIEEVLSTPESFKLYKEESRRIVEPVGRVVSAMGRQENILQGIKRMTFGQRLLIKNVKACSSDSIFREGLDQCALIDSAATTDIDQHRVLLHDSEFGFSNQTSSLLRQWQAYRDIVTLRKHFRETLAAIDLMRILSGPLGNMPPKC